MRIPSLNLGAAADRLSAKMMKNLGSGVRSGLTNRLMSGGPMTRMATRAGGPAAGLAVRTAGSALSMAGSIGLGVGAVGLSVGAAAGTAIAGAAYGASRIFNASLNTPTIRPGVGEMPFVDRGGKVLDWERHGKIPFTKRSFHTPIASNRMADMVGGTAVAAGIGGGIMDNYRSKNWSVSQAPQSGMFEIERENFMGATGSLTLSMYKQRYGRDTIHTGKRMKYTRQDVANIQRNTLQGTVSHLDRAEVAHAIHIAHMGMGG